MYVYIHAYIHTGCLYLLRRPCRALCQYRLRCLYLCIYTHIYIHTYMHTYITHTQHVCPVASSEFARCSQHLFVRAYTCIRYAYIPSSFSPLAHPNSSKRAVVRGSERLAGRLGTRWLTIRPTRGVPCTRK